MDFLNKKIKNIVNEAINEIVQWKNFDNDPRRYESYVVVDDSDGAIVTTFNDDIGDWRSTMEDAIQYAKDEAKYNEFSTFIVYGCVNDEYDDKSKIFSTDEITENTTVLNVNESSNEEEELVEAITPGDLYDILKKYGWYYTDSQDIYNNKTNRNGVRYVLRGGADAEDLEIVIDEIKNKAIDGKHTIETSSAYYKFDPSKKMSTLIVWETTPSPQMSLAFESKIHQYVKEAINEFKYNKFK